ncbi:MULTISPECIES: hypothetical protein [unclassified Enterococcus]|nr:MULTISPECIES: hypothetical protein [unclassified Enterococcus]MBO0462297.1 hypothetical protein [Enterococcus sp. DIV1298c]MBO0490919.1 hypothetical protein [Enterococcus sp. DIV1094]MBO1298925.1 hypothetical protein [Enterococcus sp. DIV1271a]
MFVYRDKTRDEERIMANSRENNLSVEEMRKRSRELSKHLSKSHASEIKSLEKKFGNAITMMHTLTEKREKLNDRSGSSKKYKELTVGINNNKNRALDILEKIQTLDPQLVDKLLKKYTNLTEHTYETIPENKKSNEKDEPLPDIRIRTEKEVVSAVVKANRAFNEHYKELPPANRKTKLRFDAVALAEGKHREGNIQETPHKADFSEHIYETIPGDTKKTEKAFESTQKSERTKREDQKGQHKLHTTASQKGIFPESRKATLRDKINSAQQQKESNSLKQGNQLRSNRPQHSPSFGR